MLNKKYIIGISGALALAALLAATPASAATTPPAGAWQGGQGHGDMMGRGMGKGMGMRPAVVGKVASINGDSITVTSMGFPRMASSTTSTTYTVDATNAVVMKAGATTTVSSIASGDTIVVVGTVSGTNVTATKIMDGVMPGRGPRPNNGGSGAQIQGNGEPVVAGTVSGVSGSTITLTNNGSVTYTIDATNAKIQVKGNASAAVSSIASGDKIIVQGTVSGTSITATSVIDQGAPTTNGAPQRIGFLGSVEQFFKGLFGF